MKKPSKPVKGKKSPAKKSGKKGDGALTGADLDRVAGGFGGLPDHKDGIKGEVKIY